MSKKKFLHIYKFLIDFLWDFWCIISFVGIWPRFIEPSLLFNTKKKIYFKDLHQGLDGFKILFFSDLHYDKNFSKTFLNKIIKKINKNNPDIILFGGDFLNFSNYQSSSNFETFLSQLNAPKGVYAVAGNHDYSKWVSKDKSGHYEQGKRPNEPLIIKGLKKIFQRKKPLSPLIKKPNLFINSDLNLVLKKFHIRLLEDESVEIRVKDTKLNLIGLKDYWASKTNIEKAYKNYSKHNFSILLMHNPESINLIKEKSFDLALAGHTHGGQVNLPFIINRISNLKDLSLLSGLKNIGTGKIFVSRGVGSSFKFRWFSPPEIVSITLKRM